MRHLAMIGVLPMLLFPGVWLLDDYLLRPSGRGFLNLDFRGMVVSMYAVMWVLYAVIATIACRGRGALGYVAGAAAAVVAFVLLCVLGYAGMRVKLTWADHQKTGRAIQFVDAVTLHSLSTTEIWLTADQDVGIDSICVLEADHDHDRWFKYQNSVSWDVAPLVSLKAGVKTRLPISNQAAETGRDVLTTLTTPRLEIGFREPDTTVEWTVGGGGYFRPGLAGKELTPAMLGTEP